jgi:hypothetical protein
MHNYVNSSAAGFGVVVMEIVVGAHLGLFRVRLYSFPLSRCQIHVWMHWVNFVVNSHKPKPKGQSHLWV